ARRRPHLRHGRGADSPARAPGARRAEHGNAAQRGLRALAARRSRNGEEPGLLMADGRRFDRSQEWLAPPRRRRPPGAPTPGKGASMVVEGAYPVFLERGAGCRVWDVDGNEYVDYILGLASITLGYAYPAVTEAVTRQLQRGSIFSLPHPLEVEVA